MTENSTESQKARLEVVSVIKKKKGDRTLRALAREIGVNHGYLSAVLRGKRPASGKLRHALGLSHTIRADIPVCPVCDKPYEPRHKCEAAPTKYAPHPVKRLTAIRTLLQNTYYKDS